MLMLRGPVKVDLIFPDVPRALEPPWTVSADTLEAIDGTLLGLDPVARIQAAAGR